MKKSRLNFLTRYIAVPVTALSVAACDAPREGESGRVLVPAAETAGFAPAAERRFLSMSATAASTTQAAPTFTTSSGPLFGVNISGAEGAGGDSLRPTMDDLIGYTERFGFKLIRYPFRAERMTAARIVELRTLSEYARSRGVPLILDKHDFTWWPVARQVAFWTSFAKNFPDDGSIMLDLANEPRGFDDPVVTNDWMQWIRDAKLVIAGLRANGVRHPILLQYPQWSASFRFDKREDATASCVSAACAIDRSPGKLDPLDRTYINAHRYFDSDASGTSKICKDKSSGLASFAAALRKRSLKGYITESAFGSSYGIDPSCTTVGTEVVAALKTNSDVLLGVTWWGGGRVWPETYHFKIEPLKAQRFTVAVPVYTQQLSGS